MSYATVDGVNALVPGVGSVSIPTSATRFAWIAEAEGEINAKLSDIYTVPFTDVPPIIKSIAQDLVQYRIQRGIHTADSPTVSDWTQTFLDARAMLQDIADKKISLTNSAGAIIEAITTRKGVETSGEDYKPIFDMRDALSWRVDPDRITDEQNEDA